jgi:PAS domain S-box-containing protein
MSVETGQVGVWVWDTIGSTHSLGWSRRLKEIFGLPENAVVTRESFLRCVHPEDRDRVDWAIMQALSGVDEGFYHIEYRIVHDSDKSMYWVTAQGQAFFDSSGKSIRFIGAVVDISDRKQVEEFTSRLNLELESKITERTKELEQINHSLSLEVQERSRLESQLRQGERHLSVAQHLSLTGSFSWFAATGRIAWSEETYRICEYDRSVEPTIDLAKNRVHPDDLQIFEELAGNVANGTGDVSFQLRLLMPDARVKHVKIIVSQVSDNQEAGVLIGAIMDITEQKRAEEALRLSEHVARGQLEAIKDTLGALARESEPDKLLEYVLRMIAVYLGANSIIFWEKNSSNILALGASFENNQLQIQTQETLEAETTSSMTPDHPFWGEVFRTGSDCAIGDFMQTPPKFRLLDRDDVPWIPSYGDCGCYPVVAATCQQLADAGIVTTFTLPMLIAGNVSGMLCTRYTKKREFRKEEIELTRSLAHQAMLIMKLVRLSRKSREAAIITERNRLARDIHDTLAQAFTGIIAQLQAAKGASRLAEASTHIEKAEELARSSLEETRRSVRALRPQSLRHATLSMALENLLKTVAQDSGLIAKLTIEGEQRTIPPEWEEGLLRIAQESLTNTIRHADAQNFWATLTFEAQRIWLKLADDGRGFVTGDVHDGFGMVGIKERVDRMGGDLVVNSQPGSGTETVVSLKFEGS